MTIQAVWNIADIFNGLMAIPNLIALLALSGVVVKETKAYFKKYPRYIKPSEEKAVETPHYIEAVGCEPVDIETENDKTEPPPDDTGQT